MIEPPFAACLTVLRLDQQAACLNGPAPNVCAAWVRRTEPSADSDVTYLRSQRLHREWRTERERALGSHEAVPLSKTVKLIGDRSARQMQSTRRIRLGASSAPSVTSPITWPGQAAVNEHWLHPGRVLQGQLPAWCWMAQADFVLLGRSRSGIRQRSARSLWSRGP